MKSHDPFALTDHVTALVDAEIAGFDTAPLGAGATLAAFHRQRVRKPRAVPVTFSGGITQYCYLVTRSNGRYSVVYLPTAGYFSLCVDSDFGPLDIGVHGPALGCFASV